MTREQLIRKLRDLRRLERRYSGDETGGPSSLWDEFFALHEGVRVRYPLRMLLVFDRASRDRAFREYLAALWIRGLAGEPSKLEHDRALLDSLGLAADSTDEDVRAAFRRLALEVHPDLGGDETLMRELIDQYRNSSYGSTRGSPDGGDALGQS